MTKRGPSPLLSVRAPIVAKQSRIPWQRLLVVLLLTMGVTPQATAKATTVQGWLGVVWTEDSRPGRELRFFLSGDDGVTREVALDQATMSRIGGANLRAGVRVHAVLDSQGTPKTAGVNHVFRLRNVQILEGAAPLRSSARQITSYPYAWILCRYSDDPSTPFTPGQVAYMTGTSYPGAGDFYDELSEGHANLAGTTVYGWYNLPKPRSAYVQGSYLDLAGLTSDCVAAADADVYFPGFYGITIQVNGDLDTRSTPPFDVVSHGGGWSMNVDGVSKRYGGLWMSGIHALNYVVVHHEMGHSLGWLHSSGPYGETYDSRWDIMSAGYIYFDPVYGWMGPHTIAWHKDMVGWIPPQRIWRPGPGTPGSALLLRSALPPAGQGYQAAFLPIATSPGEFYTVEARHNNVGYDRGMPGDGVIIHRVNPPLMDRVAQVVDPDNNGDPNDNGAIWLPGETFTDASNGVTVRVDSAGAAGYWITLAQSEYAVAPQGRPDSVSVGWTTAVPDSATITFTGLSQSWTARHSPGATWVALLTPSGTGNGTVRWQYNPTGLTSGSYVDTIWVDAPGAVGSPGFVEATLEVVPSMTVSLSAKVRRDSAAQGSVAVTPDSALVTLSGFGSSTTAWTATHTNAKWVTLSSAVDTGTGMLRWNRHHTGLKMGIYVDTILINVAGTAGAHPMLLDSLMIGAPITMATNWVSRHDSVTQGALRGRPDSVTVSLEGIGSAAIGWKAIHGGSTWMVLTADSGTGTGEVGWSRDPTGLAPGVYIDTIKVVAADSATVGSPAHVIDTFYVYEPAVVASCAVTDIFDPACLSTTERRYLDASGNADGTYNIGDLLAFLDRKGLSLSAEAVASLAKKAEGGTP